MAANSIAKLAVLITGDATPLKSTLASAAGAVQAFAGATSSAGTAGGAFSQILSGSMLGPVAVFGAGMAAAAAGVAKFAQVGIAAAANMEQLRISFEVMTGSARKAADLIADMQKLSLETPLEMADVQQAGKTLMAMGEPTEAIIADLKMLGDVAAGTGQPLNELSQVFGQVMQAGRLTGNELRQFNERGVPLLTTLSEQMGVSKQAIRDMVESGQIGADDVVKAFEAMTGAGGRFANMMERQTDTLIGQWNKFKENITVIAMNVMTPLAEALKNILKLINDSLEALRSLAVSDTIKTLLSSTGLAGMTLSGALGNAKRDDFPGKFKTSDPDAVTRLRAQEQAQKDAESAASKAAAELKKMTEDMQKRGEAMAKSLRTPFEVMRDSLTEAIELLNGGAISAETYERAVKQIGDAYGKTLDLAKSLREADKPIAAYQRFSAGAFSAVQSVNRETNRMIEEQRKSQLIEKEIVGAVKSVETALKSSPTTKLKIMSLN